MNNGGGGDWGEGAGGGGVLSSKSVTAPRHGCR